MPISQFVPRTTALAFVLVFSGYGAPGVARADFISASGAGTITYMGGDGSGSSVGPAAIPAAPNSLFLVDGGPISRTTLAISYSFDPSSPAYNVFIPAAAGPSRSPSFFAQLHPVLGTPPTPGSVTETFSIAFTAGAISEPSMVRGLGYPVFAIQPPGDSATFSGALTYTVGATSVTQTLPTYSPPPGTSLVLVTAPDVTVPAVPAFGTLTVSGTFTLTETNGPAAGSSEIKIIGVPEPSSLCLVGIAALGALATWRRHLRPLL